MKRLISQILLLIIIFTTSVFHLPISAAAECAKSTYTSGGYTFYAFTDPGSCTFTFLGTPSTLNYLVVGGGGGGGSRAGGGGGAGGLLTGTGLSVVGVSNISVIVGAGGTGVPSTRSVTSANKGGDSNLSTNVDTFTAIGGGGGSDPNYQATAGGGSTGGAGGALSVRTATVGQGNSGGSGRSATCSASSDWCGGGGGGAGVSGGSATTTSSGTGGNGLTVSWVTTSVANALGIGDTSTAGSVYFAGGGSGGSGNLAAVIGTAGLGGGGQGYNDGTSAANAGKSNTGGGGGGGGYRFTPDTSGAGGNGGSGIVLIRVPTPSASITFSSLISLAFRTSSNLTASTSVPGKVTFFANGKRIPGCISIRSNLTATCTWKPATHGAITITATIIPSDSNVLNGSIRLNSINVEKKSGLR